MAVERDEYEFITRFKTEAEDAARSANEYLKQLGDNADRAGDKFRRGADDIDYGAEAMRRASVAAAKFGSFLAAAYTSFRAFGSGLREFSQFETAMVGIAKVSDLTDAQLRNLGDAFKQTAADVGLAKEAYLETAQVAGQLGVQGVRNIQAFTAAMVDLGGASDLAASEGATAIARMLNATGENVEDARTLASVLVELGNNVAATESEIIDRAQEIALATAAFKTSTTEALALGATMAELGLRAETSGTAVGRIFIAMAEAVASGGDDLKAFADAVELTTGQFTAFQEADPTGLFYRLLEILSDKSQNEIISVMTDLNILNAENAKTLIPLISGYERLAENRNRALAEQARPDALTQEADRARQTLARNFQGLLEQINNEVIQLGEALAPVANLLIDLAQAGLSAFDTLPEPLQSVTSVLLAMAPAIVAARLAFVAASAALSVIAPLLGATATGAAGVTGALFGISRAGAAAGAGMSAAGVGVRAFLGPISLLLAGAAVALPMMFDDTGRSAYEMQKTLQDAESAMGTFAEASERAAREQENLRGGVTKTTQALLTQSRTALQNAADQLERDLAGIGAKLRDEGRVFASELEDAAARLAQAFENNPSLDELLDVRNLVDQLRLGMVSFDQFRDRFEQMTSVGAEAFTLIMNARDAVGGREFDISTSVDPSVAALLRYADATGLFTESLVYLDEKLADGDIPAASLAFADLTREIEQAAETGELIRETLPEGLIAAIAQASDLEVQLAAITAALQGNFERAQAILDQGNPFAAVRTGAEDAEDAVRGLNSAMGDVYGLYDSLTALDPLITDRGAFSRGAVTAAERGALDLIAYSEGTDSKFNKRARDYNTTLGYDSYSGGPRDLVNMTISEIYKLQDQIRAHPDNKFNSSAVGRYQFVETTLRDIVADLRINPDTTYFDADTQDRLATELLRQRRGGGVSGLRATWRGLDNIAPDTIMTALGNTDLTGDPEALRYVQDQVDARRELTQSIEESVAAAEFELSLIGKTVGEQARLRAEYEALAQAKRDGIDLDAINIETGRTYREEIAQTAIRVGELAEQEKRRNDQAARVAEAQEFYNQQQEAFKNGVLDAILEGKSLIDVLGGIAKAFARAALEAALFGSGPFGGGSGTGLLSGVFGTIFGGITNALTGGGVNVAAANGLVLHPVHGGASYHMVNGGLFGDGAVLNQSMMVPLAKGGAALLGEAGPEGVLPLQRGPDGRLGVSVYGQGGGYMLDYHPSITINAADGSAQVASAEDGDKLAKTLDAAVLATVHRVLAEEMQNGGIFNPAVKPYG